MQHTLDVVSVEIGFLLGTVTHLLDFYLPFPQQLVVYTNLGRVWDSSFGLANTRSERVEVYRFCEDWIHDACFHPL